jgi:hypothetical protein
MPRDGARRKLAERVEEHLEHSNFEIDETRRSGSARPISHTGEAPHRDAQGTVTPVRADSRLELERTAGGGTGLTLLMGSWLTATGAIQHVRK